MLSRSCNTVKLLIQTQTALTRTITKIYNNNNNNNNVLIHQTRSMRAHAKTHPDGLTRDVLIEKLVCDMMFHGNKEAAWKVWYDAAFLLKQDIAENTDGSWPQGITPKDVLYEAIENCRLYVKLKKSGWDGAKMIPEAIPYFIQQKVTLKLFTRYIKYKKVKGKRSSEVLYTILKKSFNNEGPIFEQRQALHKLADQSRLTI